MGPVREAGAGRTACRKARLRGNAPQSSGGKPPERAPRGAYTALFRGSRVLCLYTGEAPFLRGSIKTQKAPRTGELQILLERISQAAACCRSFFQNTLSSMKPMPSSR